MDWFIGIAAPGATVVAEASPWLIIAKEYADTGAAICAALAFAIALITARSQHKHNRLSVVPLPEIKFRDMEDEICIELINNGNGPMIINRLSVLRGTKEVADQLINAMPADIEDWTFFVGNVDGRSLRAGDSMTLLERGFNRGARAKSDIGRVRFALGQLTILVQYTDIYRSTEKSFEKSLVWFHRHEPNAPRKS